LEIDTLLLLLRGILKTDSISLTRLGLVVGLEFTAISQYFLDLLSGFQRANNLASVDYLGGLLLRSGFYFISCSAQLLFRLAFCCKASNRLRALHLLRCSAACQGVAGISIQHWPAEVTRGLQSRALISLFLILPSRALLVGS
jgi:hypothetical protein